MKKVVKYNKLIRDKVPEVIREAGWKPKTRILRKKEFLNALKKKVSEEAEELNRAKGKKKITNEIVDLQELLDALASELKLTKSEIKKIQNIKRKKRGGFKKRLLLIKQEKSTKT